MPLFVAKKRTTSGIAFTDKMNEISAMQSAANNDEDLNFGFPDEGPDYDENEIDGPPYEPPPHDCDQEATIPEPATPSIPARKPLRKPPVRVQEIIEAEAPTAPAAAPVTKTRKHRSAVSTSERSRLSCEMSSTHHRRLKIHAAMNGKSILSIIEGWIEQHCPQL